MSLPMNVTLRVGPTYGQGAFVLSMTQEEKNNERLNVALCRDGKFVPIRFWYPDYNEALDNDVASYVDAETLAKIIANVVRLAEFSAYAQD